MIAANTTGGSDSGRNVVFTLGFAIDPNAKATLDQFNRMVQQSQSGGAMPGTTPGNSVPMWQGEPRFGVSGAGASAYVPPGVRPPAGGSGSSSYQKDLQDIAAMEKAALAQLAQIKQQMRDMGVEKDKDALKVMKEMEKSTLDQLAKVKEAMGREAYEKELKRQQDLEERRLAGERRWNEIVRSEREKQERAAESTRAKEIRAMERLDDQRQKALSTSAKEAARARADEARRYGILQESSFDESDRGIASAFRDVEREQRVREQERTRRENGMLRAQDREGSVYRTSFREGLEGVNSLTRGFVLLTAAQGENAQEIMKNIVQFEAMFQLLRGGTGVVQQATRAWEAYAAARGIASSSGAMGAFMGALGPVAAGIGIAGVAIGGVVGYEAEQRRKVMDRYQRYQGTIAGLDTEKADFLKSHNERMQEQGRQEFMFQVEGEVTQERRQRQRLTGSESSLQTEFRDNTSRISKLGEFAGYDKELLQALERQKGLQVEITRERINQANATKEQAVSMRDISQAMQQQIIDSRKSAQERFGDMGAGDQQRLLRVAAKARSGGSLTAEERKLLRGTGIESLVSIADEQSQQAANAAGFNRLAGFSSFAQTAALGAISQSNDALQIKIETEIKVKLEADGKKLVEQLEDQIRPVQERILDELRGNLRGDFLRFFKMDGEKRANAVKELGGGR